MGWNLPLSQADDLIRRGLLTREQVYGERAVVKQSAVQNERPRRNVMQIASQSPCQSLWIPNWTPGLLNQWDGRHWSKRSKIKKSDAAIVATYFAGSGLETARGPRRVSLIFVLPKGRRMFDRDAPFKSCLDSLVHCRALVNDSPKWCIHGPVSYARAIGAESVIGTLILLEDL